MSNITQTQENAVIMAARGVIAEFNKLSRKDKKLDTVRKDIIDKWYSKLHRVISRTQFIHYIATESGVIDKLRS
jgi:hypothetical protein